MSGAILRVIGSKMRNDVWDLGYFKSDWKQSGTKEFLSPFWQKTMD